ncbi:MAG: DNA primase [Bacteroidales bacterium]|nr:DNA primase [Bacteroidales bacterium]
MIDSQTISKIMSAARIEEVIGDFVSLRKRGANYVGLCPFHDEKTPSFSVSPSKGICKCFSCGKGGNVVHFIMEHEQLSYYEALKWLAKKYHIEVVEKELSPEEQQRRNDRESMFIINEFARDFFVDTLHNTPEGRSVGLRYFQQERGLRDDIIRQFQLGFSPEKRDELSLNALRKGYSKDLLVKTGLSVLGEGGSLYDRYRERVIFPVHTVSGKVVAFGGRILKKSDKLAKYVNSPESEIYSKSAELYGLYFAKQAIVKMDRCFLVEGYLDVISMHQAGICNVVASSGTSLTHGQIRLIHRFTENVTVLYDGDAAGIKASLRGINLLLEEGLNIKVVLLPEGEDPDSYAQSHSSSEFMDYIKQNETDFIRFKTAILLKDCGNDPLSRASLIQDLVESIALIPNEIIRSEYIKECSRSLDTREDMLLKEVNKRRWKQAERNRQQRDLQQRYQDYRLQQTGQAAPAGQAAQPDMAPPSEEVPFPTEAPQLARPGNGTADTPPQLPPKQAANSMHDYEKNLLRMIVRYGERSLFTEEDGHTVSVLEYIMEELQIDQVTFSDPCYRKMYEEACQHISDPNFVAERYFLQHQDSQVSLTAAELVTDRYELSKIYLPEDNDSMSFRKKVKREEDMLGELIPHLIEDWKYKILKDKIKEAMQQIKQAQRSGDNQAVMKWMTTYRDLRETEKVFAKALGERIISL